jgi:hypothetical protein
VLVQDSLDSPCRAAFFRAQQFSLSAKRLCLPLEYLAQD